MKENEGKFDFFCVGLEFGFGEGKLPRWRVMVAQKDSGWPTDSYHRISQNAVVSGGVVSELDAKCGKILVSNVLV